MSDEMLDRNLKRLLGVPQSAPEAAPEFREALRRKLHDEAAHIRTPKRGLRPWAVAAAAALLAVVSGLGIHRLFGSRPPPTSPVAQPLAELPKLRVPADRALVMEVARGSVGSLDLVRRDAEIAHLRLEDGAEVLLQPDSVPVLAVHRGFVRVEALDDLKVTAGQLKLHVSKGADLEIAFIHKGDGSMNKSWFIPGGIGAAAGAAFVAILLHQGNVQVETSESRPAAVLPERPLVVEVPATRPAAADERDSRLAQAERKITELEKKLAASKKEGDKLASELVQKKGVTIDSITARLAELRKGSGFKALLGTADLIADIKGLGPAGVQALVDLLHSEDPKDRFIAAKLLEDLKDPSTIPALREVALNDADSKAANMAGHALALMGDPRALETLREMAEKKRSAADEINSLWGLVNLGDQQGLEMAIAYVGNSKVDAQARASLAANVAALMTDRPEVMPIVDTMVRDFHENAQIMEIAIDYYRHVNTGLARDRLQAIANDSRLSQAIRDKASQALAQ